jgi:hypothetical protein
MRNIIVNTAYGIVMLGVITLFMLKETIQKERQSKDDN